MTSHLFDIRLLPMDLGRFIYLFMHAGFRTRMLDLEGRRARFTHKGGCIIACNHSTLADPLVLGSAFWRRRMFFLTGEIVMQGRIRSALLRGIGCIGIDRGTADLDSIHKAVGVLKSGKLLGIFPQGHITHEEAIGGIKGGAILIALQAGVPIQPVYIHPPRHRLGRWRMVLGEALDVKQICPGRFPSLAQLEEASHELLRRMEACRTSEGGDKT